MKKERCIADQSCSSKSWWSLSVVRFIGQQVALHLSLRLSNRKQTERKKWSLYFGWRSKTPLCGVKFIIEISIKRCEAVWSRSMSVHFEERSGVVPCKTPWGSWYQTMEEVFIEVNVPHGTSAKEVKCHLGTRDIDLDVKGKEIFKVHRASACLYWI